MLCYLFQIKIQTLKTLTIMKSVAIKAVYLTQEEFDIDLEICLIIINKPRRNKPYYVCEYTSAAMYKSIVHIYIKK